MQPDSRSTSASSVLWSARSVALSVLIESARSDEGVDVLLDRMLSSSSLDRRDRALAVELAYGVLRRLGTIDWRLAPVLNRPLLRLPIMVQMLIRLGAYQLLYLDRVPQSAAVNESVRLAKAKTRVLGRDWSGFINAVLRALIREPPPCWPSIEADAAKSLAVKHSVPEWLSRRWVDRLGAEQATVVCEQASRIPPVTLRVNRLKTTRENYLRHLHEAGMTAAATIVSPVGITLEDGIAIPSLPGFAEGLFYVEDEAAQLIPLLLEPQPGEAILDACAAPGGKATHIAELMNDTGTISAVDRKGARIDLLRANCARLGITCITPLEGDVRQPASWRQPVKRGQSQPRAIDTPFDRILVDAPCSGFGVLRRHPEAKWRKDSSVVDRHHNVQVEILRAVAPRLRPGGVLVYSTCSTEPEETTAVVEEFCRFCAEFRRESVGPWLPEQAQGFLTDQGDFSTQGNVYSMDAFYASRLRKVS